MSASWPEVSLEEVCELKYGRSLPESARAEGDVPVFGSNGRVGSHDEALTSGATIVIGRKGSYGEVNLSTGSCWPIDTTYYVDATSTSADLGWLFHRLAALGLNKLNRAAAVPGLNREDAYRQRLLVPPLSEQRRIADILDRADALRDKRRAALALLDTLTQSIFFDMFGDPATNPMNWPMQTIGDVANVVTGNTPPRAEPHYYGKAIEWIKSDNINPPNSIVTPASEGLSAEGRLVARIAPPGATLITCIAGSPNSIGNAAMTNREVAFNQQINALIPRGMNPRFLYGLVTVGKRLIQGTSTSAMKGMVTKSRLQGIEVFVPPTTEQERFATRASAVDKLKAAHRESLAQLDALFASLQHRAFLGEL